ncbi:LacI family DNA-binding transcriptional regulator [Phytoactinopolyspora mesophila]|uniref:LacI family DNA-binding transcriptional regulator n=1 Tax=Phytoactinopolyspora mesophila TaxID=2650750 RepID=A0A7K3M1C1_9ACTN|nr:LacI family DNA-binding transcriptional regulator [Phytoactinopolyspora mesophila]NDL57093.1 LacI family DNA-binding transcriptional regulator [Phytoactinopolyspora mesophila]
MRDVAERAGVSIATVSFVVNNTKRVAPATRERIEAAMAELGFRRNVVARALASRRTHILAVAYPALQHRLGSTAMGFITSAASAASEHDYHLVLWPVDNDGGELSELMREGLVDGIVLMEVLLHDPRVDTLLSARMPFAMIGRTADPTGLAFVDIDFEVTVEKGLDHLQGLGHREIVFVSERPPSEAFRAYGAKVRAEAAFRRSCAERGLEPVIVECAQNAAGGRELAHELIEARPRTTAIMIMNEHAAFGVVSGLARRGVRVPTDLSLLSISTSSDMGATSDPVLSIMRSPGKELGRLGVELVIAQLEGNEPPGSRLLPCELEPGESTAPAPPSPPSPMIMNTS